MGEAVVTETAEVPKEADSAQAVVAPIEGSAHAEDAVPLEDAVPPSVEMAKADHPVPVPVEDEAAQVREDMQNDALQEAPVPEVVPKDDHLAPLEASATASGEEAWKEYTAPVPTRRREKMNYCC